MTYQGDHQDNYQSQPWMEMRAEGYVLLEGKNSQGWKLRCPVGHEFVSPKFDILKRGTRCGKCSGRDPYINFARIKQSIEAEGWKVIYGVPPEYRRFGYKMLLQNPEGKQMWMTGDSWERGTRSVRGTVTQNRSRTIEGVRKEFETEGYQLIDTDFKTVKTKMESICPKGHQFQIHYNHWKNGVRCSVCFGTPKKTDEEIIAHPDFIASGYKLLRRERRGSRLNMVLGCENNHEWSVGLSGFFTRGDRCPSCNPKSSRAELEILSLLQEHYPQAAKSTHLGFEVDIFIPEKNFAVEYCGLYWHSTKYKDSNFHYLKYKKCLEAGIKLYTIFEDEWIYKKEIVLARLLPPKNSIYARDTEFVEITKQEARAFEIFHHLQGYAPNYSTIHVGLRHQGKLVATMSFGPHHRDNKIFVLQRLTFSDTRVAGGVEKMLKNANLPQKPIVTWSDNRWSWGEVYAKVGFEKKEELKPDYSYCQTGPEPIRYSKQSMRKTKEERLSGKTELQLRTDQGLIRIYDCGKIRWEYTRHLNKS